MINQNNYLGQWSDNGLSDKDPDCIINCVAVDQKDNMATFVSQTGKTRKISIIDLDTSGRYVKIGSPYDTDAVAEHSASVRKASLKEQAAQSDILGDLSKIGQRHTSTTREVREDTRHIAPAEEHQFHKPQELEATTQNAPNNPVSQFIDSAIQISRKSGAKTVIPVTIPLEIDFDILNVTQMAMTIGASDVEILQHIMRYVNVYPSEIKKLIINEIMKVPDDAKIVEENREDKLDAILNEELDKHDPEDSEFKDLD